MPRRMGAVGATLTAGGLMFGAAGQVAMAAAPQTSQANAALSYLYSQVHGDGSIGGSIGATEDAVISTADAGDDPATVRSPATGASAYDYLAGHASTITTAGGAAKYALAWLAAGRPAAIDAVPLLTKLNTASASGGYLNPNGAFHNSDPAIETANVYSQSLAVLADLASGRSLPAHAIAWLTCAQRADGGFGYVIDDAAATPPASCGDTASDSNDTAISLQALGRAGRTSADSAAEQYLRSVQDADGGFGFASGSASDPGSDTVVIQALVAIGQDPSAAAWTKAGRGDPVSNLESFADPHSGGYIFPGNAAPDAFTTSAAPQALVLKPYGSATSITPGRSPAPPVSTSPSPSAPGQVVAVPSTGAEATWTWALVVVALGSLLVVLAVLPRGRRRLP